VKAAPEGGTAAIATKAAATTRKNMIIGWSALRRRSAIPGKPLLRSRGLRFRSNSLSMMADIAMALLSDLIG
jgi:hypothetical protein